MVKKLNGIVWAFLCALLLIAFAGCSDKPKKGNGLTGFEQSLSNKDSVEVTQLVNTFFQYAEAGDYGSAAGMLYKNNVDSVYEEPQPLSNEEMASIQNMLSALPIKSHTIDYIKFKEVYNNEVKCTALIMEAHDNVPEIKTAFYFKPIDHLGKWRLCMVDSRRGDKTIITPEQKDSMQNLYSKEMRDKKRSQGKK